MSDVDFVDLSKKKRRTNKKRQDKGDYSDDLATPQRIELRVAHVNRRIAQAVDAGLRTWEEAVDAKPKKGRGRRARQIAEGSVRAVSKAVRVASLAPVDLVSTGLGIRLPRIFPFE